MAPENSGVCLAAGFVLAAIARVVRVVDQNVVVACGANDAIYRFAELLVAGAHGVFFPSLLSANCHSLYPALNPTL